MLQQKSVLGMRDLKFIYSPITQQHVMVAQHNNACPPLSENNINSRQEKHL